MRTLTPALVVALALALPTIALTPACPSAVQDDDDCDDGAGAVCDFINDTCGSSHLGCVPPCGLDPNCVEGEQCDCSDDDLCNAGRCEARTCSDGFACGPHESCEAPAGALVDGNDHG